MHVTIEELLRYNKTLQTNILYLQQQRPEDKPLEGIEILDPQTPFKGKTTHMSTAINT